MKIKRIDGGKVLFYLTIIEIGALIIASISISLIMLFNSVRPENIFSFTLENMFYKLITAFILGLNAYFILMAINIFEEVSRERKQLGAVVGFSDMKIKKKRIRKYAVLSKKQT